MQLLILLGFMILALPAQATLTSGSCPDAFEGRVKALVDELGPSDGFATQKVIFTNEHTIRGDVPDQVLLDMLANGPFEVEAGKDYRVQLRKGKLCWIEAI